jgi:hypothetical protein
MGPEIAAFGAVVCLGRDRHGGEAHWISRLPHGEEPSVAEAQAAIGKTGLIGEHQQVAIGERQRRMCAASEGRIEVAMGEQLGPGRIADIEHGEPAIAPGAIGEVAGDEGVVQRVAPALGPTRRLAAARPHARNPPLADDLGSPRMLCRLSADLSCGELRAPISVAGCSTTDRPPHPV